MHNIEKSAIENNMYSQDLFVNKLQTRTSWHLRNYNQEEERSLKSYQQAHNGLVYLLTVQLVSGSIPKE